jgi:hypothetical protein
MNYIKWQIPDYIKDSLSRAKKIIFPENRTALIEYAMSFQDKSFDVIFQVEGKGVIKEATVSRCKNGIAVNYSDAYMRRRDPDCTIVGDSEDTNKPKFHGRFGKNFSGLKTETFKWIEKQELIVMPFLTGKGDIKYESLFIGPANCGFFAMAISDLQTIIKPKDVPDLFNPKIIIYLAPVFRHTHFNGKQVVVHDRGEHCYEIFSYNLYPGPSAKKGIYGALLNIGEKEGWLTLHAAAAKLQTPYDNYVTFLHEGASGGGKSEMNEYMEHSENNRMILGKNISNNKTIEANLINECSINPVSDDMTMCHPEFQKNKNKLTVSDAENAWFVRVNHMDQYGVNPHFEKMCIHPKEPLIFLNVEGIPGSTCLLWEHIEDSPGKACPNPRVIFPRRMVPGVVDGTVEIDYRSFGVRTPPCTKEKPTYGIIGYFHILPPALAWLWRLVAPRGHDNPSIIDTGGMTSEGVGTYGPFLTGNIVKHANLILNQLAENTETCNVLFPNQNVGAWDVGFMPQWFSREYLARRGGRKFLSNEISPAASPLLGYIRKEMKVEGIILPDFLLDVRLQPEVGEEAYRKGEKMFYDFFERELKKFRKPELCAEGKKIIKCFDEKGSVEDYKNILV